jgi:phosphohistidine phosphatase
MDLYVIRHASAEDRDPDRWPDDSKRPLTDRGRERLHAIADTLGHLVGDVDMLLSSRFTRAWETAEMLSEETGWPRPQGCPQLEFASASALFKALKSHGDVESLALVGHEPSLSEFVSYLLTGDEGLMYLEMKKGGVVCLHFEGGLSVGAAALGWVMTPKMARLLHPTEMVQ